jgi:hypothetical protein
VDAPRSKRDHTALQRLVDDIFGTCEPASAAIPTHEIDELLLLSSWFRKFPGELERTTRAARPGRRKKIAAVKVSA